MLEVMNHRLGSGHHSPNGSQGFRKGGHNQHDLVFEPVVLGRPGAASAQHAKTVGVINQDVGLILLGQTDQLRQLDNVAIHGEDPVGDNEFAGIIRAVGQLLLQNTQILVWIATHRSVGQTGTVNQTRVVELIEVQIVAAADQAGHHAQIGLVAGAEDQGGFFIEEAGQAILDLFVQVERAVQKTAAGTAAPVALQGIGRRFNNLGVVGQTQVVIRTHHDHGFAVHPDLCPIRSFDRDEERIISPGLRFPGPRKASAFVQQFHPASPSPVTRSKFPTGSHIGRLRPLPRFIFAPTASPVVDTTRLYASSLQTVVCGLQNTSPVGPLRFHTTIQGPATPELYPD